MSEIARRAALVIAYALIWTANRWPAIRVNTLFFDDFAAGQNPAAYYLSPYRPVLWLEHHVWSAIVPEFLWTHWPKIAGAFYTGLAAMALALLLRKWNVPGWLAASVPLLFVVNPVLADGTLWNTTHALPLGVYFGIESIRTDRRWATFALALLAACTYQVFIAVPALLVVAEVAVRRRRDVRELVIRFALIGLAAVVQVGIMSAIRVLYPGADARGLAHPASLSAFAIEKWHGATNLIANGWMPVIAWYAGAALAMSLWKWIPIALTAANGVAARNDRMVAVLATMFMLALPAAPILVSSFNPDAWRAAIPVAVALAVAFVPLLAALPRALAAATILLVAALMAPVSWYESSSRVIGFEREQAFAASIRAHWNGRAFAVGFGSPIFEDPRHAGPHDLTWGFERRTPAMWTMLFDENFTRPWLVNYHRFRWTGDRECRCGPVTYHEDRRTSVICGQSPPCTSTAH